MTLTPNTTLRVFDHYEQLLFVLHTRHSKGMALDTTLIWGGWQWPQLFLYFP